MDCDPAELERRGEELRRITSNTWIRWWDDHLSAKVLVKRAMVQPGDTIESLLERVALSPSSLSRQTAEPGQAVETSGHGDPKG
jgi:hypothetical protein